MSYSSKVSTGKRNISKIKLDNTGSLVTVVKINAEKAYVGVSDLLKKVIDESDDESWRGICNKIDYMYANLNHVLDNLGEEPNYRIKIVQEVQKGKILLFKPNLVVPINIDPFTHGEGSGNTTCTEWPFIAALMRWFHDKLEISYNQMALGETATLTSMYEGFYNLHLSPERPITTEALIEGKSGDFYGGWGFYFVRRYLTEKHQPDHDDDPMNGYEESVSGTYVSPGKTDDKLMIYDLNKVSDVKGKGRAVPVPEGENFTEITLHKAVVGGAPEDPEDIKDYPGCVLINVPRLKLHSTDLLTNALKSLGLGLYPMEAAEDDDIKNPKWKYSYPNERIPGMKSEVPHLTYDHQLDETTNLPLRDKEGNYLAIKTGGIAASQVDVIKATTNQDVFIVHVIDAIQAVNLSHTGSGAKINEGMIFASLDPVALDTVCARYCFKTVPMEEAQEIQNEKGLSGNFLQRVPIPYVKGQNIVNGEGFDSPLLRYNLYSYAESRGLGQELSHVRGWDATRDVPLGSKQGHLGWYDEEEFHELITSEFYYNPGSIIWDLQHTVIGYVEANDLLTGSSFRKEMFDALDDNQNGIIEYDERGRNNCRHTDLRITAINYHLQGTEQYGFLRGPFIVSAAMKYGDERWNAQGHYFFKEDMLKQPIALAYNMSQVEEEKSDPFFPDLVYGKGKWPSLQYATFLSRARSIFGSRFPSGVSLYSLYGHAFQYADKTLNQSKYTGDPGLDSAPDAIDRYLQDVREGKERFDFVLFVPEGFGKLDGEKVPNVVETDDPQKMFTARFDGDRETWGRLELW